MYKTWALTKMLLRTTYADMIHSSKKKDTMIFTMVTILFAGFIFFGLLTISLYAILEKTNQQGIILGMGLTITSIWIFLTSTASILSVFYYEDDVENLLPLPLQPSQIVTGKFFTVLLTQYISSAPFILPILIIYGIRSGATFFYYIHALCSFLFLPIIPLVIASLVMTLVMRFTNIGKNKDRGKLWVGLFTILFVVGINVVVQINNRSNMTHNVELLLTSDRGSLLVQMTKNFPTTYFAAMALLQYRHLQSMLYLFLFVILSFLFFGIFYAVAQRYYLKGVVGLSSGGSQRKNKVIAPSKIMQRSKWSAYFKKELRILFRTPSFFLNCIIQGFITPIIFFFAFFVQGNTFTYFREWLHDPKLSSLVLGLGFGAGIFLLCSNMTATSSFSRDGKNWFVNRYLPIPATTIVSAKVFTAWLVNASTLLLFGVIGVVFAQMPLWFVCLWLLLCMNGLWFTNGIGVLLDARTANVTWDAEQKLFRNRGILIWNFFLNVGISIVTIGVVLLLHFILHVEIWIMFLALFLLFAIGNVIVTRIIYVGAENMLRRIQ